MTTRLLETRTADPEDAEEIAAAYEEAWRSTYQGVIPHLQLERMIARRGPGWWQQRLVRRAPFLLLEFDHELCGYANLGRNRVPRECTA